MNRKHTTLIGFHFSRKSSEEYPYWPFVSSIIISLLVLLKLKNQTYSTLQSSKKSYFTKNSSNLGLHLLDPTQKLRAKSKCILILTIHYLNQKFNRINGQVLWHLFLPQYIRHSIKKFFIFLEIPYFLSTVPSTAD